MKKARTASDPCYWALVPVFIVSLARCKTHLLTIVSFGAQTGNGPRGIGAVVAPRTGLPERRALGAVLTCHARSTWFSTVRRGAVECGSVQRGNNLSSARPRALDKRHPHKDTQCPGRVAQKSWFSVQQDDGRCVYQPHPYLGG